MINAIFINLPVSNVKNAIEFFKGLGFDFNAQFTGEDSACLIIGKDMYGMLSNHEKFASFIKKPIASKDSTEAIISLSCESPEHVRSLAIKAFELGAKQINESEDHGFMFSWGFEDLDGHLWDLFWMNPEHVQ